MSGQKVDSATEIHAFGKLPFSSDQLMTLSSQSPVETIGQTEPRIPSVSDMQLLSLPTRATLQTHISATQTADMDEESDLDLPTDLNIPSSAADELLGDSTPDFVLQRMIGRGGQGEVWSATQASLQREIAVKIHKSGRVADFLIEAFTSGELDHPNIVPVYELARMQLNGRDCPLLAMKLVKGKPWIELIEEDRRKAEFSLEIFLARHIAILQSVCHAVSYAHSKHIIHRDLKPHQVVIGEFGEVYLIDWGLAISLDRRPTKVAKVGIPKFRTLDLTWGVSGTPAYMAPEQTSDQPDGLGFHTDVYLLGASLYHLVAGTPPHNAHTAEAALFKAMMNEVAPLPENCPAELVEIILKALAAEPIDRYEDVDEFRGALEDYMSGAGRQRESRRLIAEVRDELDGSQDVVDYTQLIALDHAVNRALQLWPENKDAESLHQRILYRHAELALRLKDMRLALSLACQLDELEKQRTIFTAIDREQELQRREARQRKTFLYGCLALMLVSVIVLVVSKFREESLMWQSQQQERSRLQEEGRRRLYMERADLFGKVYELGAMEKNLAHSLMQKLALPGTLAINADSIREVLGDRELSELLRQKLQLERQRADLGKDFPLESPPTELKLAQANLNFYRANSTEDYLKAYAGYEDLIDSAPYTPEAHIGLAMSALRAGELTSSTLHLENAAELAVRGAGDESPDAKRTRLLLDELRQLVRELGVN